eukprot:7083916-Karenia_brevis.AAC.1
MCRENKTKKKVSFCSSFGGQEKEDGTDEGWQKSKSKIRIQKANEIDETETKNMFEAIQEEENNEKSSEEKTEK